VLGDVGNNLEQHNKDFLVSKILLLDDVSNINVSMLNLLKKFQKCEEMDKFVWVVMNDREKYS